MGITLSEAAIFAPLLALILHAGEREKKTKAKPARPDPAPRDSTPPS
jgi:hypothetical protein